MIKETGFKYIKKGSIIGIASISGAVDIDRIDDGRKYLEKMGYKVKYSSNIFEKKRYFSGDDKRRLEGLNEILSDHDISGVILARGGFGAVKVLNQFDFDYLKKENRLIMGYSDASSFLNACSFFTDIKTVHGPILSDIKKCDRVLLERLFSGKVEDKLFQEVKILKQAEDGRAVKGRLRGGNLATIASLTGTKFMPDFKDSILFLEEINEPAYKIDRLLCQLYMSGKIDGVKGLIIGDLLNCGEEDLIYEIFLEYFRGIPVIQTCEFGHGTINKPLIIGADVIIDGEMVSYV